MAGGEEVPYFGGGTNRSTCREECAPQKKTNKHTHIDPHASWKRPPSKFSISPLGGGNPILGREKEEREKKRRRKEEEKDLTYLRKRTCKGQVRLCFSKAAAFSVAQSGFQKSIGPLPKNRRGPTTINSKVKSQKL